MFWGNRCLALCRVCVFQLAVLSPFAMAADLQAFTAHPPEKYSKLDPEVRDLLANSILEHTLEMPDSRSFTGETLWTFLEEHLAPSGLQALIQIHDGAK